MSENRRDYYRVRFFLEKVEIIACKSKEKFEGSIVDISATGMAFRLKNGETLPIREVLFHLEFEIEGEVFKRMAKLRRSRTSEEDDSTFYAVKFSGSSEKERSALFQSLMKSEARRRL